MGRKKGIKIGLIRPITLWPFPKNIIAKYADEVKGFISVEMNAGQMIEDVQLAANGKVPVVHYGRMGGMMASPSEVLNAIEEKLILKN